ncbi:Uncharacterized protein HZ326_7842 [Fusarium oxysporum f. sp. albedinis]|nr:Uncharacterized protein HZ326_7842 [Fusarium oxysporum f. sp. albedinis]
MIRVKGVRSPLKLNLCDSFLALRPRGCHGRGEVDLMRSVLPGCNYSWPSQWSGSTVISNQQRFQEPGSSFKSLSSFRSRLALV